jgi:hypothetical protein
MDDRLGIVLKEWAETTHLQMMHTPPQPSKSGCNVQVYGSLILLTTAQSCPDPARKLLHGAHCRAFFPAIGTSGRRCICVDGNNRLARKVGNRKLCVVTRCDVTSKASVALGVGGQSDEVGLVVRSGGHDGWAGPSRPCVMREQQKA